MHNFDTNACLSTELPLGLQFNLQSFSSLSSSWNLSPPSWHRLAFYPSWASQILPLVPIRITREALTSPNVRAHPRPIKVLGWDSGTGNEISDFIVQPRLRTIPLMILLCTFRCLPCMFYHPPFQLPTQSILSTGIFLEQTGNCWFVFCKFMSFNLISMAQRPTWWDQHLLCSGLGLVLEAHRSCFALIHGGVGWPLGTPYSWLKSF